MERKRDRRKVEQMGERGKESRGEEGRGKENEKRI